MIRQNKDGRPIYNNKLWFQMLETGEKLKKLGYEETYTKPNLFLKKIKFTSEENGEKREEVVFASLMGTDIIPIWDNPRPYVWKSKNLPFNYFLPEFILLKRAGCSPRGSFYDECEPGGWMFGLDGIPSGYCKRCGKDILNLVNWEILNEDFFKLYRKGIHQNIEVNYCETCKNIEYAMREYRLQHVEDFKMCELCGIKDAQIKHHITYNPEKIIRVCRSCHGKIHHKGFPNPLWKEKRIKD